MVAAATLAGSLKSADSVEKLLFLPRWKNPRLVKATRLSEHGGLWCPKTNSTTVPLVTVSASTKRHPWLHWRQMEFRVGPDSEFFNRISQVLPFSAGARVTW